MIKILFYLPLLLSGLWQAHINPLWLFKMTYVPSNETAREIELNIRNQIRLMNYQLKRSDK